MRQNRVRPQFAFVPLDSAPARPGYKRAFAYAIAGMGFILTLLISPVLFLVLLLGMGKTKFFSFSEAFKVCRIAPRRVYERGKLLFISKKPPPMTLVLLPPSEEEPLQEVDPEVEVAGPDPEAPTQAQGTTETITAGSAAEHSPDEHTRATPPVSFEAQTKVSEPDLDAIWRARFRSFETGATQNYHDAHYSRKKDMARVVENGIDQSLAQHSLTRFFEHLPPPGPDVPCMQAVMIPIGEAPKLVG